MPTDDVGLSDEDDLGIEEFAAKIEGARLIPGAFSSLSSDSARTSYIFAEYLDEVFRTGSLATLDNEALVVCAREGGVRAETIDVVVVVVVADVDVVVVLVAAR